MYSIYRLIDPRDHSVGYVGMSTNAEKRYEYHIGMQFGEINKDKNEWIRRLRSYGLVPELSIIETVESRAEAKQREAYWIERYLDLDEPLTNGNFPSLAGSKTPGRKFARYSTYFRGTSFEDPENTRQREILRSRL